MSKSQFTPIRRSNMIQTPGKIRFSSTIKKDDSSMQQQLKSNNRMSYILQKVPEVLLSGCFEQINEQIEFNTSQFNLKPTSKSKKIYYQKIGKLKVEVPSWKCCFCKGAMQMELKTCKLSQNVLQICYDKSNSKYICFDVLTVTLKKINSTKFRIDIPDNQDKVYLFEGQLQSQIDQWYQLLYKVISDSYASKLTLNKILQNQNFDQLYYVAEKDFTDRCNNGDLLLFKDDHTTAKLQRWITFSDFDHIGVVLKNVKDQVFIFQSTTAAGVSIMQWKHFIKYRLYNFIDRLAWRQLKLNLKNKDIKIIQAFIDAHKGKKYDISIGRMMIQQSKIMPEAKQQKSSFFCSQLVAALYKQLGLVDEKKSTSQYYPVTFSKDLQLLKGELGLVKTIVFQQDLIEIQRI